MVSRRPDRWGYTVVDGDLGSAAALRDARRAGRACPRKALWLEGDDERRP